MWVNVVTQQSKLLRPAAVRGLRFGFQHHVYDFQGEQEMSQGIRATLHCLTSAPGLINGTGKRCCREPLQQCRSVLALTDCRGGYQCCLTCGGKYRREAKKKKMHIVRKESENFL